MDFLQMLMLPFTWVLTRLYFLFSENYGLALVVFAFIVKLIFFPFAVRGKRGMIQMNMISGRQAELQKKYANDKVKLNEELEKLYQKEGVSRTGGCLWTLFPMFFLFPLFAVVRRPLRYLMGLSDPVINAVTAALTTMGVVLSSGYAEINAANAFSTNPAALEAAREAVTAAGGVAANVIPMNFTSFGIDLSATPQWNIFGPEFQWTAAGIGLLLIPLLSAGTSLLSSIIIQKTNQLNGMAPAQQNNMMLMLMGPVMSLWFGFIMPAGMGVYWTINNILSVVQELLAGRILKKDYAKAAAAKAERERLEKEEEKRQKAARAARIAEEKAKPKAKRAPERKTAPANLEASREGIRAYARGRAYDPARYGGVTAYKDPFAPTDEPTEEEALAEAAPSGEVPDDTAALAPTSDAPGTPDEETQARTEEE